MAGLVPAIHVLAASQAWMPGTRPGMTEYVVAPQDKSIADAKAELRREALARRDALPAAERQAAAEAVSARPVPVAVKPGAVVSGFSPLKSEINPLPLMRRLADAGARLALPVVAGRGKPLVMRSYAFGQALNE